MRTHARLPSTLILAAGLAACAWLVFTQASSTSANANSEQFAALEKLIAAGKADAQVWQDYGDALADAKRFTHAAAAYQKSLELEPDRREARMGRLLALAQGPNADAFFAYVQQLMNTDPKLTFDLLERRECINKKSDPRFEPLYRTAKAQAID